jgi:hypothetical protein
MTQFNFILELTDIFKELLESSKASYNVRHARRLMDLAFDRFEEMDGVDISEMGTPFDATTIKILDTPSEQKDYFQQLERFQSENEIFPCDLPNGDHSIEMAQFVLGFVTILNALLGAGVTPCNAHQARLLLDDLLRDFEQQAEVFEATMEDDDTPNALNQLFPNLQEDLDNLTLIPV